MGLFDFFSSKDPTLDQFAKLFIRALESAGFPDDLEYDPEACLLRGVETSESIFLMNYYNEYLPLSRSRRRQYLKRRAVTLSSLQWEIPDDFEEARPHLRPKVWSRMALEHMRIQGIADGGDSRGLDIPKGNIGSHLVASLAYDLPEAMLTVSRDNLKKWGLSFKQALEIARENLLEETFSAVKLDDSVYVVNIEDGYDACRLLLPSLLKKMKVKGDLIAVVPNRDLLLVSGTGDLKSLQILLDQIKKGVDHPRPILESPLRWTGKGWEDWLPDPSHPLYRKFCELKYSYLIQVYEQQKEMLDAFFEKRNEEIFVADYFVRDFHDGRLEGCAVWSNTSDFLLPVTESVSIAKSKHVSDETDLFVPWARVQEVLGHLMQPTDYYPPLVRVQSPDYPSKKILARLAD
ncbi:MAG: DUF1444 family protein [Planctomycetaceae bacterium]|nr:DUF1444 family protein [Planctomycetaceae bacterium]